MDKTITGEITKASESLGLVFGWAIVCKSDGADYFDTQNDHIPEDAMLKAAVDFMVNSRVSKDMHAGEPTGQVVFTFPMTEEIAKAYGIETQKTGLMFAYKPTPEILKQYIDGTRTGFSIGGARVRDEDVDG